MVNGVASFDILAVIILFFSNAKDEDISCYGFSLRVNLPFLPAYYDCLLASVAKLWQYLSRKKKMSLSRLKRIVSTQYFFTLG